MRARVLAGLLFFGILALWAPERWSWSVVQVGVFVVAAIRLPRLGRRNAIMIAAAAWPLVQLAAGTTVSRGQTWLAALDWWTFAVLFLLAADLFADRAA